jgi:hypothetical protein
MTEDLVKRLRNPNGPFNWEEAVANQCEAADRIERLEAALREVLSLGDWGTNILARTVILEALEAKD